jgi:uncharacterized protein YdaU (DUF1376 family)
MLLFGGQMASDAMPWFKLYPRETLSDGNFSGWSLEERGAWFTLILHNWLEGSIPSDMTSLGRLLHLEHGAMRGVWSAIGSRFIPHPDKPGMLTSPRLEIERECAREMAIKRSKAGIKAITARWNKEKAKHTKRIRNVYDDDTKSVRSDTKPDTDPDNQIQTQIQVERQPTKDRLAGLDDGLMSVAKRLGDHFGRGGPLGVGKDWAKVSSSFGRWLSTVGEDFLVAECIRLATEKDVAPSNLSWWPGWLDTATDEQLRSASK